MRVASMPMYDLPEARSAIDSLWAAMAHNLRLEGIADVPGNLVHGRPLRKLWDDSALCLSQCCGYDLVNRYAGKLVAIATPRYGAPECKGYDYTSVVIVHEDCPSDDVLKMRGAVCVINGLESHSGMGALRSLVAPVSREGRFFSEVKVSGSHADSIRMVQQGEADVAAVDCVTFALLKWYRPVAVDGVRKLGRTYRAPGIPYVARATEDEDTLARMRAAIFRTFTDAKLNDVRRALFLGGVEVPDPSAYQRISKSQQEAARHGYPQLA